MRNIATIEAGADRRASHVGVARWSAQAITRMNVAQRQLRMLLLVWQRLSLQKRNANNCRLAIHPDFRSLSDYRRKGQGNCTHRTASLTSLSTMIRSSL